MQTFTLAKQIMSTDLFTVLKEQTVSEAAHIMATEKLSCIIVVDQHQEPVGIVTERDLPQILNKVISNEINPSEAISNHMSFPVMTAPEEIKITEALMITVGLKIRHLPITTKDNKLTGILTQTDLVRSYVTEIQSQKELIEQCVSERTAELEALNKKLETLSMEDPLMMIGNRRAMEINLNFADAVAHRHKESYAIALLDIDHFKRYNDHYGHQKGDEALREVAQILKSAIRKSDQLYRYGGEEILLLMPKTGRQEALTITRRATQAVQDKKIEHSETDLKVLTTSAGIATNRERGWQDMITQADKALYQAKSNGRNRVEMEKGS